MPDQLILELIHQVKPWTRVAHPQREGEDVKGKMWLLSFTWRPHMKFNQAVKYSRCPVCKDYFTFVCETELKLQSYLSFYLR